MVAGARMTARHNAVFPVFDLDHRGIRAFLRIDSMPFIAPELEI